MAGIKNVTEIKAIIFSDLHLHTWPNPYNSIDRLGHTLRFLKYLGKLAFKHQVPLVFCGDLFHTPKSISQETFHRAKAVIDELPCELIAISGNHDQAETNTPEYYSKNYLTLFPERITLIDYLAYPYNNINYIGIPYLKYGFDGALAEAKQRIEPNYFNILMVHANLPNAKTPSGFIIEDPIVDSWDAFKGFDLVLSGHIHRPAKLHNNIYMIGAPYQQTQDEMSCTMGYWVLHKDYQMKFINTNKSMPRFMLLETEEIPDEKNFYIRYEVVDDEEEDQSFNATDDILELSRQYLKASKQATKIKLTSLTSALARGKNG